MRVLILGTNGLLGPHVVRALEDCHELLLTDINDPPDGPHEFRTVDVASSEQIASAAEGMDAIINCTVLRKDRRLAFDVNALGCYNTMNAAVRHGIPLVINTGPHFMIAGPTYEGFDSLIGPDVPPHPGTNIYALTKSLGQEICRVFTENHNVYVITLLFYSFWNEEILRSERGPVPFVVTWSDAAQAIRCALDVSLDQFPSRCEAFFILTDTPHQRFRNDKAKRILGWQPRDHLERAWR